MYRKIKAESVPLTPELARQFAEMTPLPGERDVRATRTAYLTVQLLRGKFSGPEWAYGVCLADGLWYRLDGNHSSKMLHKLPKGAQFPEGLLATVTTFEFDTMADAADVFELFNNPKSVRNNEDRMGIYQAYVMELAGYSRKFLVNVGNGLHEYELQRKRKGAKDAVLLGPRDRGIYYAYPDRPDFVESVHWLAQFRDMRNGTFLQRSVIVADMLTHRAAHPAVADEFWQLVFTQAHPDPDHETKVLAEWFREQLAAAAKPKLDMTAFRKKTLRAWKAYVAVTATKAA